MFLSTLVSIALAAAPVAPSCPGAQVCGGACISLAQVCRTAVTAPPPVAKPPVNDLCKPTPVAAGPTPVGNDKVVRSASAVACTVLGGCDYNSPMLHSSASDPVTPPCGGPEIPASGPDPGAQAPEVGTKASVTDVVVPGTAGVDPN